MNVRPTRTGPGSPSGPGPTRSKPPGAPARSETPEAHPKPEKSDRVVLFVAARQLEESQRSGARASGLSPERLREVLERVARGFYDHADVRDQVLQRLIPDLENDPS